MNFRPLRRADFALLQRWFATPHVDAWWRQPHDLPSLEAHYGPRIDGAEPTAVFVLETESRPAALLQWYRWSDYPAHARRLGAASSEAGMDLAIGEAALLGRGLGPRIIRQFLDEFVWVHPELSACVVDPEEANQRSTRAFAKAGFLRHGRADDRVILRLARHGPTSLQHWGESGCAPAPASPLERTALAERVARSLLQRAPKTAEGKMLGVMIVDTPGGCGVLQAFSGLLGGQGYVPGWVPPLSAPEPIPGEAETVQKLAEIRRELEEVAESPVWAELQAAEGHWSAAQQQLAKRHRASKVQRDEQRGRGEAPELLAALSLADSNEKRRFRQQMQSALQPVRERAEELRARVTQLKRERRALSRALQTEMHARSGLPLAALFPNGPPTGVGECCAPKLLHYAVSHGYVPRGLAEIWHGPPLPGGARQPGEFYAACDQRCQPLLAPMLAALSPAPVLLFVDDHLVAADKPAGLLTVPGRRSWNQQSLLQRVQVHFPDALPVHRLDLETSGVVLFARSREVQACLQKQFSQRKVRKLYVAVLEGVVSVAEGEVVLPLGPDESHPGRYRVSPAGKQAVTGFRRLEGARVEFYPQTGRSHQLRVHAASGLQQPIVGDPLYGTAGPRMLLHACALEITHPVSGHLLSLRSNPPF